MAQPASRSSEVPGSSRTAVVLKDGMRNSPARACASHESENSVVAYFLCYTVSIFPCTVFLTAISITGTRGALGMAALSYCRSDLSLHAEYIPA